MSSILKWFTAFNVLGTLVLALWLLAPGPLSELLVSGGSVEIQLIPIDTGSPRAAAALDRPIRIEVPAEFRPNDLSTRPWDELPDGRVRMRD